MADFGCGDAKLAQSMVHKVHSFDLVAVNKYVTKCDITNVSNTDKVIVVTSIPKFLIYKGQMCMKFCFAKK